jgi:fibronectin-binding autotransporter adhesin
MRTRLPSIPFLTLLMLAAALVVLPTQTAHAATCSSVRSGVWNDPGTWSCGLVPGAGDSVTINDGHTVTLTADADVMSLTVSGTLDLGDQVLTVHNSTIVNNTGTVNGAGAFHTAGTVSLSISGSFNPPLTVASGTTTTAAYNYGRLKSAVIVAGGATLSVSNWGGLTVEGNLTAAGTLAVGTSAYLNAKGNLDATGTVAVGADAGLSVYGNLSTSGALTGNSGSSLYFYGSSFFHTGSALTVANVSFRGSGTQILSGSGFANWTGAGSFSVESGAIVALPADAIMAFSQYGISGTLSLNGHTLTLNPASALTFTNSGTFDIGAQTFAFAATGGATFNDDGSYGGGTVNGTGIFRTTGTVSLNVGGAFNPPLTIASGATTITNLYNRGSLNGGVTVASGAALNLNGVLSVKANLTAAGTLTVANGYSLSVGGDLSTTGTLAIGANATLSVDGNLSVNGSSTWGASTSLVFSGSSFSLTGSALSAANVSFRGNGTQTLTGGGFANWTGTGSFEVRNGASVALPVDATMSFSQYTISGAFSLNGHTLTLNPTAGLNFYVGGGPFDIGNQPFTLAAPGDVSFTNYGTVNGAGTIRTTGTVRLENYSAFNPPLTVVSGTTSAYGTGSLNGTVTIAGDATLQVNYLTINGNLTSDGTLALGDNGNLTVAGNLSVNGAATWGNSSTLYFSGSTFSLAGSTLAIYSISFRGNGVQTLAGSGFANWTGGGSFSVASGANVALPINATMSFSQYTIDGAFSLNGHTLTLVPAAGLSFANSGTLDIGAQTFTFAAPTSATFNNSGTVNGAGDFRTAGAVILYPGSNFNPPLNVASGTTITRGTIKNAATVASGATLAVPDQSSLAIKGNLTAGALVIGANATLSLAGDLTATNSGTSGASTGRVVFNGAGTQNLTANTPTSFANLTVNSGVTLIETVAANNVSVTGTLTNLGTIRKTQTLSGAGPKTFGLTGVQVDVTTVGSLTSLQVDRVDSSHPNATVGVSTGRYWILTPTGAGYTVNLTLPHNALSNPIACRYTGSDWDCARTAFTSATVTRNGVSALSPWAVGHARSKVYLPLTLRE